MILSRRRSSIGHVDVGDTQGASLGTSLEGDIRSRRRQRSLSQPSAPTLRIWWMRLLELQHSYTWLFPGLVILATLIIYFFSARFNPNHWLWACVCVSYQQGNLDLYGKGWRDLGFVLYYSIVFAFLREFLMQMCLKPLALRANLGSKHKVNRFLEQFYSLIYYGISGPVGLYIMYGTPQWYFNTRSFYEGFPHKHHEYEFKNFYLLQAAFWTQQAFVLIMNLEKRRKDFKELVFHHLVTIALILLSYVFHFAKMGLPVFITMDVSDFFLAISKLLNYIDSSFVAVMFFVFIASWVYLRHYLNIVILWSVLTEFSTVGPFELEWGAQQYKCRISQIITFVLLLALQLVNIYWLVLIIRIAYRFIVYEVSEDVRSEDEDEELEAESEAADKAASKQKAD